MRPHPTRYALCVSLVLLGLTWQLFSLRAQPAWPYAPPPMLPADTSGNSQRAALNQVRTQVGWVQNATRTASNYGAGGADVVYQQFQILRDMYSGFTRTLNPLQLNNGANEWAELSAGLDIIQESFVYYQQDIEKGRPAGVALKDLCQVMREASQVWLQQFNRDCTRLRVGF